MEPPKLYVPKAFEISERELFDFVDAVGVGHVATYASGHISSSFVPLILDRENSLLRGHLSRSNQHWRSIIRESEALVTITGVDAYISPSYYPSKAIDGAVVPTWNYELVQIRGSVQVFDDPAYSVVIVRALTDKQESSFATPWSVDDAPREYIDKMLAAIVGFEIKITDVSGKRKLSQNRPDHDRIGVIDGLAKGTVSERQASSVTPRPGTEL
jgi:transcriptional regulator